LTETEKLSALGQLSSGLAHDFNNILAAIMGYVEMAMYEIPKTNIARQSLDQVLIASHRAKDLVRQILAFNRRSERVHKPILLSAIAKEVLSLIRASIPSTIKIVQHLELENSVIMADATQIHQVLMNLCTNAHHSMRESGGMLEITLTDLEQTEQDALKQPELIPGTYLKLSVKDTGHGMDPQTVQKAFDPYFTTKEKEVGTGMGLAVVQGIVKNHSGTIRVKSEPGKGTVIDVLFPRIGATVLSEDEKVVEIVGGAEKILFVDDEEPLVDIGQKMLEQLGYSVVAKSCPKEALKIFKETPMSFNLVITDMTMPAMTGDILAGELMAIRSDIPIILCTGHSDLVTHDRIKDLGIKDFLLKPHSIQDLAAAIRKALDHQRDEVK
jgi:two-component system cell cycle sensor histidine kinase/response regulator CckA